MKHKVIPASFMIMQRGDGKILLLKRYKTKWRSGWWSLPAGHGEKGESFLQSAIRETKEEVGVDVQAKDVTFSHINDSPSEEEDTERASFYFICRDWSGEPFNAEPHKASEIGWFDIDDMPEKTIKHVRESIIHSFNSKYYSTHGYDK